MKKTQFIPINPYQAPAFQVPEKSHDGKIRKAFLWISIVIGCVVMYMSWNTIVEVVTAMEQDSAMEQIDKRGYRYDGEVIIGGAMIMPVSGIAALVIGYICGSIAYILLCICYLGPKKFWEMLTGSGFAKIVKVLFRNPDKANKPANASAEKTQKHS